MVFSLCSLIKFYRASCFCNSVFFIKFVKGSHIIFEGHFCFILIFFSTIIICAPNGVLDYLILSHIPELLLFFLTFVISASQFGKLLFISLKFITLVSTISFINLALFSFRISLRLSCFYFAAEFVYSRPYLLLIL